MSGCVKMNSPREGSRVNPETWSFIASKKWTEDPYKQYPEAMISFPPLKKSSSVAYDLLAVFLSQIEKILPIDTLASMLELPSKGSKDTTYLPWCSKSTFI